MAAKGSVLLCFCRDQRRTDLRVEPDLVVEAPAIGRELPVIFAARLAEERADQPVMQIQGLVRKRCHRIQQDRHQCRIPAQRLILLQLEYRGLGAFARES